MDILHPAVWVSDLETTADFYEDVLDLTHSKDFVGGDGATNYFISGESDTEIQFKYDENADVEIDPGTMDHIAVGVEDVDATAEYAVEEWGSEIVNGPLNLDEYGIRIAFITDPEGYTVEIIQDQ